MTFLGGGGPVFHRGVSVAVLPPLESLNKLSGSYIFDIKDYESVFILMNPPWTRTLLGVISLDNSSLSLCV